MVKGLLGLDDDEELLYIGFCEAVVLLWYNWQINSKTMGFLRLRSLEDQLMALSYYLASNSTQVRDFNL